MRNFIKPALLVLVAALVPCPPATGQGSTPPQRPGDGPRAAVWEHYDDKTGAVGAAALLENAGFEVVELPRDRSVSKLDVKLIVLGAFISDRPAYQRYMKRYAAGLREFVEQGGVVLQLTQDPGREPVPPFLPRGMSAVRGTLNFRDMIATDEPSVLLGGLTIPVHNGLELLLPGHPLMAGSLNTFSGQEGFRVLLWCDSQIRYQLPVLLEGGHGRGRILLTSMYLDKVYDDAGESLVSESFLFAARLFFGNLRKYVSELREGSLGECIPSNFAPPAPAEFVKGSWTLVLLPDPQNYSEDHPDLFDAQTEWIVGNREELDIRYVIVLGDLTNRNLPEQWRNARKSMKILDGKIPYVVTTGNHDYIQPDGHLYMEKRKTLFNRFFQPEQYLEWPTFGGTYQDDRLENSYHLFSAGGRDWIILSLEWLPRNGVVEWAGRILEQYQDRSAILVTHEYLEADDSRIRLPEQDGARHQALITMNDGEDIWNKLASRHRNVLFVLSGHVTGDGAGLATAQGDHGNKVHQMMVNFQMRPQGGEGYLRTLEFLPDGKRVQVRTFSPYLDRYMSWDEHQFTLDLDR